MLEGADRPTRPATSRFRCPFRPPVLVLLLAGVAAAAPNPQDLSHASIEELMNIEISSVSRKQQRLSETAAAVYVINREEIRRSGAYTIPELLRMVPGLHVARIDAARYAVSSRGFNGRLSNKMLVLIDGRSVYSNVYSGVFWEHFHIPVEDIERIEVIRGPGATVWGANAVNGVINIITAPASETAGTMVTMGAGLDEAAALGVRHGGKIGKTAHYRIYGRYSNFRDQPPGDDFETAGGWSTARLGFRLDWDANDHDRVSLQGDLFRGMGNQIVAPPLVARPQAFDTDNAGGFGMVRWTRKQSERSEFSLQSYFSREHRCEYIGAGYFDSADLDFQHRFRMTGRHELVWGGGYRMYQDRLSGGLNTFDPKSRRDGLASSFVQDEISLVPEALTLTVGAKVQHNTYTGVEVQPGSRLSWSLNRNSSLWFSVARAVRTPSRLDEDLSLNLSLPSGLLPVVVHYRGNRSIRSETLLAWEAGYRHQVANRVSVDIAAFTNGYDRMRGVRLGAPSLAALPEGRRLVVPGLLDNVGEARLWGGEVTTTWELASRWKVAANYSMLRGTVRLAADVSQLTPADRAQVASPIHQVQVRSMFDITRRVYFDANAYHVGSVVDADAPAYTQLDARIGWRINDMVEVSAGGANLQSPRHKEFIADDFSGWNRIRRTAYVRLTWRF
jgi:iron complex outermembrane receptor protein